MFFIYWLVGYIFWYSHIIDKLNPSISFTPLTTSKDTTSSVKRFAVTSQGFQRWCRMNFERQKSMEVWEGYVRTCITFRYKLCWFDILCVYICRIYIITFFIYIYIYQYIYIYVSRNLKYLADLAWWDFLWTNSTSQLLFCFSCLLSCHFSRLVMPTPFSELIYFNSKQQSGQPPRNGWLLVLPS